MNKQLINRFYRQISLIIAYDLAIILGLATNGNDFIWRLVPSILIFTGLLIIMIVFSLNTPKKEKIAMIFIMMAFLCLPTINILPTPEDITTILNLGFLGFSILAIIIYPEFYKIKKTRPNIIRSFIILSAFALFYYIMIRIILYAEKNNSEVFASIELFLF